MVAKFWRLWTVSLLLFALMVWAALEPTTHVSDLVKRAVATIASVAIILICTCVAGYRIARRASSFVARLDSTSTPVQRCRNCGYLLFAPGGTCSHCTECGALTDKSVVRGGVNLAGEDQSRGRLALLSIIFLIFCIGTAMISITFGTYWLLTAAILVWLVIVFAFMKLVSFRLDFLAVLIRLNFCGIIVLTLPLIAFTSEGTEILQLPYREAATFVRFSAYAKLLYLVCLLGLYIIMISPIVWFALTDWMALAVASRNWDYSAWRLGMLLTQMADSDRSSGRV